MQPQVRDIQSLLAEQRAALAPQNALIDESLQANATSGDAQVAGLDATRKKVFSNIEQTAQDKGMFFSGFSPDAQAEYTGSTYLPAVAQLQSTIAQARGQLLGKKADLEKGAFDTAFNTREGDVKILNDWNQMTAQQQFQASEADKQRVFQAQQAEQDRKSSAAIAAGNRAAKDTPPPVAQFLVSAFSGYDPNKSNGYTEREIIPALVANYGISREQAAQLAYNYRKQNYNE